MSDINKKAAEILVLSGYAGAYLNGKIKPHKNVMWGIDDKYVDPFLDTLESRRQVYSWILGDRIKAF